MAKSDVERVRHLIQIDRWNFDYVFGVNEIPREEAKHRTGSYYEYRQIWIEGPVLRPVVKASHGRVICFPESPLIGASAKWITTPMETETKVRAIGHVEYGGKNYSAHLSFPADMLGPILTMLSSGKYRYVTFEADKSQEAFVYNFSFSEQIDEDDL